MCRVLRTAPLPAYSSLPALDLLPQTDGIQIHAEHVGTAVQSFQAAEVLLAFLDLQGVDDGLQLSQQRIGRDLEGLAVVVDALQVAGIAASTSGISTRLDLSRPRSS